MTMIFFFSTRPPPGLLPVLGPLGSGTDATHLPSHGWVLYISTSTWVLRAPNAGRNSHFQPIIVNGDLLSHKLFQLSLKGNLLFISHIMRIMEKQAYHSYTAQSSKSKQYFKI